MYIHTFCIIHAFLLFFSVSFVIVLLLVPSICARRRGRNNGPRVENLLQQPRHHYHVQQFWDPCWLPPYFTKRSLLTTMLTGGGSSHLPQGQHEDHRVRRDTEYLLQPQVIDEQPADAQRQAHAAQPSATTTTTTTTQPLSHQQQPILQASVAPVVFNVSEDRSNQSNTLPGPASSVSPGLSEDYSQEQASSPTHLHPRTELRIALLNVGALLLNTSRSLVSQFTHFLRCKAASSLTLSFCHMVRIKGAILLLH